MPELNVQEYVEHISAKGFENLHDLTKKKKNHLKSNLIYIYIYIYKLKFVLQFITTCWTVPAFKVFDYRTPKSFYIG